MTDPTNGETLDRHLDDRRQLEASLAERHAELAQAVQELGRLYETFAEQTRNDIGILIGENEDLHRQLAETDRRQHDTVVDARFPDCLREIEELKEENLHLRDLLQEREELLQKVSQEAETSRAPVDAESFEAELYRDRQQLEADRQKLTAELQQLRMRNEELDEARREMEMEFSRERADLARERTRLERLREEVRAEVERFQRDGGVQKSLMSVHKLRETLAQQKSSSYPSKR